MVVRLHTFVTIHRTALRKRMDFTMHTLYLSKPDGRRERRKEGKKEERNRMGGIEGGREEGKKNLANICLSILKSNCV